MFKSGGNKISVDKEKANDPFCRYQMASVVLKDEGFGNGLRTVFVNLEEISHDLARNKNMIMTYLSSVLGCGNEAEKDEKDDSNIKWVLKGRYTQGKIQECIYEFISHFVLCKHCKNPETKLEIVKKNDIVLRCAACSKESNIMPNKHTMKVLKRLGS